jgi:gamma-glutamyl hydrolase
VVPILYDLPESEVRALFSVINGVLLPGGGASLRRGHKFYDTAELLVNLAIEANDNGDYFPVGDHLAGVT